MSFDRLKPCPFCGGEARLIEAEIGMFEDGYAVYCDGTCDVKMGVGGRLGEAYKWTPTFRTEAEAIEAWNTRAERTCHVESMHGYTDHFASTRYSVELSCHTLEDWPDREPPEYCPWCGAKVVKDETL